VPQRDPEVEHVTTSYSAKDPTQTKIQKFPATKTPRHPTQVHDTSRSQQRPGLSPTRIARQEMRSAPRQQVIRRVTTTFEVPVKEEDIDDEELEESASVSASGSTDISPTTETLNARRTKSLQHRSRQQSKRSVQADDDDDSYVEDEVDDDDGRAHSRGSSGEEEDDELMMGAEDNRKDVYGTHRVTATPLRPNRTSTVSRSGGSSSKKRKQAVGRASGGSAIKARRI